MLKISLTGIVTALFLDIGGFSFKPRLHERFFACDGDAIFF